MTIGTKIYKLRTAKNLSQGDLADMLNVSRQSVSKWETDAAVPDLDKLMRLCDVFAVTLDELTCRETKEEAKIPPVVTVMEKEPIAQQKIIGYILLAVSLLAGILIWIFAEREDELYIPIPIIISVLTCSFICLFVKQKAGYWCAWAVAAPIVLLTPYVVGLPIVRIANSLLMIFAVIMSVVARMLFAKTAVITNKKRSLYVILGWIALVGLRVLAYVLVMGAIIDSAIGLLPFIFMDLLSYIGTSLLLTYTVCYITSAKRDS